MGTDVDDLSTLVRERSEDAVGVLAALVRVARDGHDAVQQHVASALTASGADVDIVDYRPRTLNIPYEIGEPSAFEGSMRYVVGRFGHGSHGTLFWAHSDSEPVNSTGWTKPLFDATTEGSRMYGWGIADDLVGVAMMLAAARLHQTTGVLARRPVIFASVPSKQRAQAIVHALDHGVGGAASVYLHPAESGSGFHEIKASTSGLLRFRIRVRGRRPQTSEPEHTVFLHTAIDPMPMAAKVILALQELGEERANSVRYGPLHDAIGRSTNILVSQVLAGDAAVFGKVHEVIDIYGSMTFPPTEPLDNAQAVLLLALDELQRRDTMLGAHPPEIAWITGIQGAETSTEGDLYRTAVEAIETATGHPPRPNSLHAASDIRNPILHRSIPTVGLGPLAGNLTVGGGVDEWVDLDDYLCGVEVVLRIATSFARP